MFKLACIEFLSCLWCFRHWLCNTKQETMLLRSLDPHEDAGRGGGLSQEYVLRIPSVSSKATNWGGLSESPYKRVVPCRCRTGTLKNPAKCLWRWEPDRRYNFFFSPSAHLCRHIYDWNIVNCDVKQPFTHSLTYGLIFSSLHTTEYCDMIMNGTRLRITLGFFVISPLLNFKVLSPNGWSLIMRLDVIKSMKCSSWPASNFSLACGVFDTGSSIPTKTLLLQYQPRHCFFAALTPVRTQGV